MLQPPPLTLACGSLGRVAATVDVLQFALGPLGWAFADGSWTSPPCL
jgi:hypothetical protein